MLKLKPYIETLAKLIRARSLSGFEGRAGDIILSECESLNLPVDVQEIGPGRRNIAIFFGTPKIVFSTHYDVVQAPESLFEPTIANERVVGRGACDALGILVCMLSAATRLIEAGYSNFGLVFVVGEEDDGIGAKGAGEWLKEKGIQYLVNGEPTQNNLAIAQKGVLEAIIKCQGKSCHSGYPHLGEDANRKLVKILEKIYNANFGSDDLYGLATVNVGLINGGSASNIVSPHAQAQTLIRTVTKSEAAEMILRECVGEEGTLQIHYRSDPCQLYSLPNFPSTVVAFGSDIPNFAPIGCRFLMCGPGNIDRAHTDFEFITFDEMSLAIERYFQLYKDLSNLVI